MAGGIPLVLVEAAKLLDADQRTGRAELPDPLPIGTSGQRVVDLLLQRLAPNVLNALVVAAAERDGDLLRIIEALGIRGPSVAELEAAEEQGVVVLDGDRLTFRHPLMRSAAYHDARRGKRRAAHRRWPRRCRRLAGAGVAPGAGGDRAGREVAREPI